MFKKIRLFFCLVFIFSAVFSFSFVFAQDQEITVPAIQVHIGDFKGWSGDGGYSIQACGDNKTDCISLQWLNEYISVIYKYGVGLAAVLAAVMIMVGGFIWLTSGGSPDKVGKGKEFITSSLLGLGLALFSFVILAGINPNLVNLKPISLEITREDAVCCMDGSTQFQSNFSGGAPDACADYGGTDASGLKCGYWGCCADNYLFTDDVDPRTCGKVTGLGSEARCNEDYGSDLLSGAYFYWDKKECNQVSECEIVSSSINCFCSTIRGLICMGGTNESDCKSFESHPDVTFCQLRNHACN